MIPRQAPGPELLRLAAAQAGVVSRAQAIGLGTPLRVIDRLTRDGHWHQLTRGIYSVDGRGDWHARAWAGVLLGGQKACLGHEAAGYLHSLIPEPPATITVHVCSAVQRVARPGWTFLRSPRRSRGEPPRSSVPDTILDLAVGMGGDALASLLSTALAGRLTTQQRILRALAERGRHPARALLVDMLSDVGAGAHGALEVRYVRDVERAHGLPTAVRQAHLTRRHRADGWYRDYGVLVELDGRLHHFGNSVAHDAWRDNDHALLGQVTLRYGWPAISADPCLVARQVATALAARGWLGTATCCSRCRLVPR